MGEQGLSQTNILTIIKRIDSNAKDIVDRTGNLHAVYMFDDEKKEWKKTAVDKALFIYSRHNEPHYGVYVNSLNAVAFAEPITAQTELKIQAPFIVTRNEQKCT